MERLLQNFNYAGIKTFVDVLTGDRGMALPHIKVHRLHQVNWQKLKDAGIRGCIFDKDNTLTRPFERELEAEAVAGLAACKSAFGNAVVLFSNSAGLMQYDAEGGEAECLERTLDVAVLRHKEKKPGGGVQEIEEFFGCSSENLAMIGDRLLTDVVYGNLNKMLTIYVEPFDTSAEPIGVKLGRQTENKLWADCKKRQIQPPSHSLIHNTDSFIISETESHE